MPDIRFRPVAKADLPLIEGWMNRPHWRKWWGDPITELGYIADMIEGRDCTRPFLFYVDERPAGLIQYWFVGHFQSGEWLEKEPWLADCAADAIGVDIGIGDEDRLGQGLGALMLKTFTRLLAQLGYRTILIDPDPANVRAVRAYRKAGFVPRREYTYGNDKTLLMELDLKRLEFTS